MSTAGPMSQDEKRLAELGYKQELHRGWSGFSNFAISFSIISVLAGCFTTYGQALKNGGPIAISIAWPLISLLVLTVAFSMSELASAMPTAGGIYYWASKLGGAGWGWFTGWFNLIGLVAVVASVDYVCATFLTYLLGLYNVHFIFSFPKAAGLTGTATVHYTAHVTFAVFAAVLLLHGLINVFSLHSTGSVTIIENEPHLIKDLKALLEKLVPAKAKYEHEKAWNEKNGFSHLRGTLLGFSVTIPVVDGVPVLGPWQQVIFIENDLKGRPRNIRCTVIGE